MLGAETTVKLLPLLDTPDTANDIPSWRHLALSSRCLLHSKLLRQPLSCLIDWLVL